MSKINNSKSIKEQYANGENLSARMNLHAKHSTNKFGISNWLFDNYNFTESCKILELGCGVGNKWDERIEHLPSNSLLILSNLL